MKENFKVGWLDWSHPPLSDRSWKATHKNKENNVENSWKPTVEETSVHVSMLGGCLGICTACLGVSLRWSHFILSGRPDCIIAQKTKFPAVCFDHFPPFSLIFAQFLFKNCCDYLWRKTDIDIITDAPHTRTVTDCVARGMARLPPSPLARVLWPSFAFKFSYVTLPPPPVQSSCMPLIPIADTGLQGWLNRNYTHLAAGHRSTTSHKVATMHSAYNIHHFSYLPEPQRGN